VPHGVVREVIPAPAAEVFRVLHNYDLRLAWDTLLQQAYLTDGHREAALGATCVCKARRYLGGVALKSEYVSFRPPEVAAVRMITRPAFFGSAAASIRHRDLSPVSSSLEYTYHFVARPRWLRWLLHPVMKTIFTWEARRRFRSLGRYLERTAIARSGLYPQVLGEAWTRLPEAVRTLHSEGPVVRAVGTFRVHRGTSRFVRLLTWLARLPAAAEAVDMSLVITPRADGEEWRRLIGRRLLASKQYKLNDGLLGERVGPLELRLRLEVSEGKLLYRTESTSLRWGPLCLPLPRWLAPTVKASEQAEGDGNRVRVSVEMNVPWFGRVMAYEGRVERCRQAEPRIPTPFRSSDELDTMV
jgi:Domain of unknown function (DUF4166)/Polyketide cyclase / dehydrase and lipid transport